MLKEIVPVSDSISNLVLFQVYHNTEIPNQKYLLSYVWESTGAQMSLVFESDVSFLVFSYLLTVVAC